MHIPGLPVSGGAVFTFISNWNHTTAIVRADRCWTCEVLEPIPNPCECLSMMKVTLVSSHLFSQFLSDPGIYLAVHGTNTGSRYQPRDYDRTDRLLHAWNAATSGGKRPHGAVHQVASSKARRASIRSEEKPGNPEITKGGVESPSLSLPRIDNYDAHYRGSASLVSNSRHTTDRPVPMCSLVVDVSPCTIDKLPFDSAELTRR